ncbi:hypothetical protein P885DRAFT_37896 [Corynascus similis CBS 632.67]
MSGIMNKIKEAVHPDLKSHQKTAPEGSHGPHSSHAANAADPRVDSDRDNSRTVGTGAGRTAGHGEYGSTGYGTGAAGYGTGTAEGTHGPHGSRVANAADPRVDSDLDNSRTVGTGTGPGTTTGATAFGAGTTGGYGSGTTGGYGSGAGSGATGMTGTHGAPAGTHGPHSSRVANAADPRVDSDRDGRGALGTGPGPASNTAGPHSSDMANKMDPRVDSDLDGSRTVGGNKTYQSGSLSNAHRDPTDAAQVPPSVLQKHVGGPSIEHEDTTHHRERRNSIKTHQETFRGI